MGKDWHEQFKRWAKPPSDTEEAKGSRAARMINDAVRGTRVLDGRTFEVYPTGSYRNNTNIRLGSDVDVAIVLKDAFFSTIPAGKRREDFGLGGGASYGMTDFRRDIGKALIQKFGSDVSAGNITFDIQGNSGRLPADATPFLQHRRFTGKKNVDGSWHFLTGVETRPADGSGTRIINWHSEHYTQGVQKNAATNRRYKRVARIFKNLSLDMAANGTTSAMKAAAPIPSFLIECLVFNAPDGKFNLVQGSYYEDVKAVLTSLWHSTKPGGNGGDFVEVSRLKWLFKRQSWTMAEAHEFLLRAWQHVGFKS